MDRQNEYVKPLSARCDELGITLTDLASRTGLSLRALERIDGGQVRSPHLVTRKAIAKALKCDVGDIWPAEVAA